MIDAQVTAPAPVHRKRLQHGHARRVNGKTIKSLTYQSWSSMNDRCYITTHRWYKIYGGEGVQVCEQWRRGTPDAFAHFLADMGERPAKDMTLDRWPNTTTKNYEPGNCRWADKATQTANRRNMPHAKIMPSKGDADDFTIAGTLSSADENRVGG